MSKRKKKEYHITIQGIMKTSLSERLGKRIKELRISKGIKQCELADLLGMERSNLTRIESGKQRPSDEYLEKIAKILNIEIQEMFDTKHLESREELINRIQNILPTLNENEIRFCYKTIYNLSLLQNK